MIKRGGYKKSENIGADIISVKNISSDSIWANKYLIGTVF